MEFHSTPITFDFSYNMQFNEPFIELIKQDTRPEIIRKLLIVFDLGIDGLRVDTGPASNKALEFSKFFGPVWFNVSIGIERIEIKIQPSPSDELINENISKIYEIFDSSLISVHYISVRGHFDIEEGRDAFIESLNPTYPPKIAEFISSRGFIFSLQFDEDELEMDITVVNSFIYPEAIYCNLSARFYSNKYDFQSAYDLFGNKAKMIMESFNLHPKKEV